MLTQCQQTTTTVYAACAISNFADVYTDPATGTVYGLANLLPNVGLGGRIAMPTVYDCCVASFTRTEGDFA